MKEIALASAALLMLFALDGCASTLGDEDARAIGADSQDGCTAGDVQEARAACGGPLAFCYRDKSSGGGMRGDSFMYRCS